MKTSKQRKKSKVVRGPQLPLKGLGRAKGEPPRTVRLRYVEPPARKQGSPFFAVRVPRELLAAFKRLAREKKETMQDMVRGYMSTATGVEIAQGEE